MAKYSCIFRMPKKVSVFAFRSWLNVLSLFPLGVSCRWGVYAAIRSSSGGSSKKSVVVVVVFIYYYNNNFYLL